LSAAPGLPPTTGAPTPAPIGLFQFSIEGRRAPALFVVGWISVIVGVGATVVGVLSAQGGGSIVLFGTGLAITSIGLFLLGGSQTVEREAAGLEYAGPSPVLVFAAASTTALLAILLVGTPLELAGLTVPRPLGDLLQEAVEAIAFIGVVHLLVIAPGALRWRDMGFGVPGRQALAGLVWGAAFAVPLIVVTGLVGAILISLLGAQPAPPLPATGSGTGLLLNLATGAVLAPIAEEILFRGVAATAWARTGTVRRAVVRSAVLFAIAHILTTSGDSFGPAASLAVVSAVTRLPVALALGWVYLRSGTIWSSIGLHAMFNGVILVLSELNLPHG
jgi:membrane protease YdiL (CAAX protease family)